MSTKSIKRTVKKTALAVGVLFLTLFATAVYPLGRPGSLVAKADGNGVLLPDGTYTITWSETYDRVLTGNLYDPGIATYSETRSVHGVYSGVGTVIFHNTGAGSGTTTTVSVTHVHADLTDHFQEHDIHYPFGACANQWTYDRVADTTILNPDQYLNVVSTIPMFRLEPFVAPDGTTEIHWPITSNPSSPDPTNDGTDPRFVQGQSTTTVNRTACDGSVVPTQTDTSTGSVPIPGWARLDTDWGDLKQDPTNPSGASYTSDDTRVSGPQDDQQTWHRHMTLTPEGVPVAKFTATDTGKTLADAGTVTFDAGTSQAAGSPITTYAWDFGDGTQQTTSSPTINHRYTHIKSYPVSLVVTDSTGTSSVPTYQAWLPDGCNGESAAPVTLPAVDVSYSDLIKVIRVGYGDLPLTFASKSGALLSSTPPDALCEWGAGGTLPVTIGLGPFIGPSIDLHVDSDAYATLDFLSPGAASPPDCAWGTVSTDCVVGGSGDVLVRWHTGGFRESAPWLPTDYTSPAFTYYERVPGSDTYAQAIQAVEPELHVTLTRHLGWINTLYAIQEPPADVSVTDAAGNVTGVSQPSAAPLQQIPGSLYVNNGQGYSAVLLFEPSGSYTVKAVGSSGLPFSLSLSKLDPSASDPSLTQDVRITGTLGRSGEVDVCYDALQTCTTTFVFTGYQVATTAQMGSAVPVRIGIQDTAGNPASNVAAQLDVAPVTGQTIGAFRPAQSVGHANQGNAYRETGRGQYMFNLDTGTLSPGAWVLRSRLPDGSTYTTRLSVQ